MTHKAMIKIFTSFVVFITIGGSLYLLAAHADSDKIKESCSLNTKNDLVTALEEKDPVFLLDVREPQEFLDQSLQGSVNIPLAQIEQRLADIPKDKRVLVICRSGRRSAEAVEFLEQHGYKNVKSLEGGMMKWNAQISLAKGCA